MTHESKRWNPSHWSEEKVRRYLNRVQRHTYCEMTLMIGPHLSAIEAAELRASIDARLSQAKLHSLGVQLLGDTPPKS